MTTNSVLLPYDKNGGAIQSLAPSTTVSGTIGGASSRVAIPSGAEVVRIAAAVNCYVVFGNSSVNATSSDLVFPAGVEMFTVPEGATHFAFIQLGVVTGAISVTKMV